MEKITLEELKCPCCGKACINLVFLERLRTAREYAGVPFIITSGYRCEKHNKEVGSTSRNHIEGRAADIKYQNNSVLMWIIVGLVKAGFTRMGIHRKSKFIHVDNMDKITSCWGY